MSQYQPNATPGRSFIEKINSKFSSLSVSSTLQQHVEKDGNSEDDTLIHKAFVKFFDERNEPYPEWLGVKNDKRASRGARRYADGDNLRHLGGYSPTAAQSQFQPVRASYNSVNLGQSGPSSASHSRQGSLASSEGEEKSYTRRTNSRLQAMYNKSRQQSVPGAGYLVLQLLPHPSQTVGRTSTSQRLRDRVMNGQN